MRRCASGGKFCLSMQPIELLYHTLRRLSRSAFFSAILTQIHHQSVVVYLNYIAVFAKPFTQCIDCNKQQIPDGGTQPYGANRNYRHDLVHMFHLGFAFFSLYHLQNVEKQDYLLQITLLKNFRRQSNAAKCIKCLAAT